MSINEHEDSRAVIAGQWMAQPRDPTRTATKIIAIEDNDDVTFFEDGDRPDLAGTWLTVTDGIGVIDMEDRR